MFRKIILVSTLMALFVGCNEDDLVIDNKKDKKPLTLKNTYKLKEAPDVVVPTKELTEEEMKKWAQMPLTGSVAGMDLDEAYKLLEGRAKNKVIVAVIDNGVDINHEDLKGVIWTNTDEIPDNGIDDDKNGYVDDVHGWNFLGGYFQTVPEYIKFIQNAKDKSSKEYQEAYKKYQNDLVMFEEAVLSSKQEKEAIENYDKLLAEKTGKAVYTKEDLEPLKKSDDETVSDASNFMIGLLEQAGSVENALLELNGMMEESKEMLEIYKNYEKLKDNRPDNPNDISDSNYGDNKVQGSEFDDVSHGTHVSGIIGAVRDNNIGVNGIADAVTIMPIRAMSLNDENDKDVALAIKYAVDNGAKIINMSFGKPYSSNKKWVRDMLEYAQSKDVLIVHASGNDGIDIDVTPIYPDDNTNKKEFLNNFLSVGAHSYYYNEKLIDFSNYGKENVDIFASGKDIYSTVSGNMYEYMTGTSMATPQVSGLAGLLRSYFPELTAVEVKQIILESGIAPKIDKVIIEGKEIAMTEVCKTNKIINAYNAIALALNKTGK